LLLSPLPDEGEKTQSACGGNHCFIARTTRFRILLSSLSPCLMIAFSLGEGLGFLPFFRKGKKYPDYPVNPVSSKLIYIYAQLFMSLYIKNVIYLNSKELLFILMRS